MKKISNDKLCDSNQIQNLLLDMDRSSSFDPNIEQSTSQNQTNTPPLTETPTESSNESIDQNRRNENPLVEGQMQSPSKSSRRSVEERSVSLFPSNCHPQNLEENDFFGTVGLQTRHKKIDSSSKPVYRKSSPSESNFSDSISQSSQTSRQRQRQTSTSVLRKQSHSEAIGQPEPDSSTRSGPHLTGEDRVQDYYSTEELANLLSFLRKHLVQFSQSECRSPTSKELPLLGLLVQSALGLTAMSTLDSAEQVKEYRVPASTIRPEKKTRLFFRQFFDSVTQKFEKVKASFLHRKSDTLCPRIKQDRRLQMYYWLFEDLVDSNEVSLSLVLDVMTMRIKHIGLPGRTLRSEKSSAVKTYSESLGFMVAAGPRAGRLFSEFMRDCGRSQFSAFKPEITRKWHKFESSMNSIFERSGNSIKTLESLVRDQKQQLFREFPIKLSDLREWHEHLTHKFGRWRDQIGRIPLGEPFEEHLIKRQIGLYKAQSR